MSFVNGSFDGYDKWLNLSTVAPGSSNCCEFDKVPTVNQLREVISSANLRVLLAFGARKHWIEQMNERSGRWRLESIICLSIVILAASGRRLLGGFFRDEKR